MAEATMTMPTTREDGLPLNREDEAKLLAQAIREFAYRWALRPSEAFAEVSRATSELTHDPDRSHPMESRTA